ncbi:MAG: CAP domain-containing protein [Gemmataceae bacterium]|nr:CAP domain-containing protein [Gemmataceae bacterium]
MRCWLVSIGTVVLALTGTAQEGGKNGTAPKLNADEQNLLELTNAERDKEKLPPLKANPILTQLARAHSRNMAKQEKLDHELDGKSPFDRLKEAKYEFQRAAENVAQNSDQASTADIMKLWLDSEPHRANILGEGFTEIGIGIAKNDKGEVYVTQVFAMPVKK